MPERRYPRTYRRLHIPAGLLAISNQRYPRAFCLSAEHNKINLANVHYLPFSLHIGSTRDMSTHVRGLHILFLFLFVLFTYCSSSFLSHLSLLACKDDPSFQYHSGTGIFVNVIFLLFCSSFIVDNYVTIQTHPDIDNSLIILEMLIQSPERERGRKPKEESTSKEKNKRIR